MMWNHFQLIRNGALNSKGIVIAKKGLM